MTNLMSKYLNRVQDNTGHSVSGAEIFIYEPETLDLVDLYEDDEVTTKANPLTSDNLGIFQFKTKRNWVDIRVSSPSISYSVFNVPVVGGEKNSQGYEFGRFKMFVPGGIAANPIGYPELVSSVPINVGPFIASFDKVNLLGPVLSGFLPLTPVPPGVKVKSVTLHLITPFTALNAVTLDVEIGTLSNPSKFAPVFNCLGAEHSFSDTNQPSIESFTESVMSYARFTSLETLLDQFTAGSLAISAELVKVSGV